MIKLIIFIIVLLVISGIFIYSLLKVSSIQSRLEEERELKWLQQEYGKSKKD